MRILTAVTVSLVAAACGGGSKTPPMIIDNAPPIDDPPAAVCPVCGPDQPCMIDGAQATGLPGLVLVAGPGADGMNGTADDDPLPADGCGGQCNFFTVPTAGGNSGKKEFLLIGGLPDDVDGDGTFDINQAGQGIELDQVIELVSTNGAFNQTSTTNFSTAADAFRSSGFLATPDGTTAFQALTYIAVIDGMSIADVYTSQSGSLVMTNMDVTGGTAGTVIRGSVMPTNTAETDGAALVAGGCTTQIGGLSFAITQGMATDAKPTHNTAVAPSIQHNIPGARMLKPVTQEHAMMVWKGIQDYKAKHGIQQ